MLVEPSGSLNASTWVMLAPEESWEVMLSRKAVSVEEASEGAVKSMGTKERWESEVEGMEAAGLSV